MTTKARPATSYRGARRNAYRDSRVLPVWRADLYVGGLGQTLLHPSLGRALVGVDVTDGLRRVK